MYCAVCEVLRSVLLHAFATLFLWKCMQFQRRTLSNRISSLLWSFLSLYPQGVCKECAGFSLQKHSSRRITSSKLQKEDLLKKETPFAEISGCFFFFFFVQKRRFALFLFHSFLLSEWWEPALARAAEPRPLLREACSLFEDSAWLSSSYVPQLFLFKGLYGDKIQMKLGPLCAEGSPALFFEYCFQMWKTEKNILDVMCQCAGLYLCLDDTDLCSICLSENTDWVRCHLSESHKGNWVISSVNDFCFAF